MKQKNKYPKELYKWAFFTPDNKKHMKILSLCRELKWTVWSEKKLKTIVSLNKLGGWLNSKRSPVQKPLKKMSPEELTTIINALSSMIGKNYK
jgi:hypothetical protein